MTLCGTRTVVKQDVYAPVAAVLRCNLWKCPDCAPRKQKALKRLARAGQPNTFLTLTIPPHEDKTPGEMAQMMVRAWRLIVKRIKRFYKYDRLPYLIVFEKHESGVPHMHLILRCKWIGWQWLVEQWQELTRGRHVHIQRVDNPGRVAGYVAKYIAKEPTAFEGCKRFWRSLDWILDNSEIEACSKPWYEKWNVRVQDIVGVFYEFDSLGYEIAWLNADCFAGRPRGPTPSDEATRHPMFIDA